MHAGVAGAWTFLTSLDDAIDLVDSVDNPQVRMAFDTYHLGQDRAVLDRIPAVADRIAIVHLGDSKSAPQGEQNRCRLGQGNLPLGEIIVALVQAGYQGDFDVELIGEDTEATCYDSLLADSARAFGDLVGSHV